MEGTMLKTKRKLDFTQGPIASSIFSFALPIVATNVLQVFYSAADMMIVSMSSEPNAVGAIGVCGSFLNIILNIFIGFSVGSNVIIARHLGSKHVDEASRAAHTAVLMSLIFGVFGSAVGILASRPVLVLMGNTGNVLELALRYSFIYLLGCPFISLTNYCVSIFRAKGNSRTPFLVMSFAGVLNVLLNLVFVLGFGMAVEGVAAATALSNVASAAILLVKLLRTKDGLGIKLKKLKIDRRSFRDIILVGLPSGIQGALFSISNLLIGSSLIKLDTMLSPDPSLTPVLNGNTAAGNLDNFVYTTMNAFSAAVTTFVSQNYGAGRPDRVKKGLYVSYGLVSLMGLAITALILLFRVPLLSLYGVVEGVPGTADAVAFYTSTVRVYYILIPYFLCGLMEVGTSCVRALGKSGLASLISLFGACVFRAFWVTVVFPRFYTLESLFVSYPISWLATALIAYVFATVLNKNFKKKLKLSSAS